MRSRASSSTRMVDCSMAFVFARSTPRIDFAPAAPSSAKMTPSTLFSWCQPATSVSRMAVRMADAGLVSRLSFSPAWVEVDTSSSISTKSLRERSARLRSRQSARRNAGSDRAADGWCTVLRLNLARPQRIAIQKVLRGLEVRALQVDRHASLEEVDRHDEETFLRVRSDENSLHARERPPLDAKPLPLLEILVWQHAAAGAKELLDGLDLRVTQGQQPIPPLTEDPQKAAFFADLQVALLVHRMTQEEVSSE